MRALVTGVAGFIGSHVAQNLLRLGVDVIGVDSFDSYYSRSLKERNLVGLLSSNRFEFLERDLLTADISTISDSVALVFHLAGQPGVRKSWGNDFDFYVRNNVVVTQRLLDYFAQEECLDAFIAASSSSIYGDSSLVPTSESHLPRPISPYGVTKLASEHLCTLYALERGLPTFSLRYFTVYGPRQRPDMLMSRLIRASQDADEMQINGSGEQLRDFTYVDDVVEANILAMSAAKNHRGEVVNIGGGTPVSVNAVIAQVEEATQKPITIKRVDAAQGDPSQTFADCSLAKALLGWEPQIGLVEGLERQVEWSSSSNNLHS